MAERSFGPAVVRRRLGSELRRLRERAGMSLEQVARDLEASPSKISRLENGLSSAKVWDVRNLLTLYGVEDKDYRRRAERWVNEGKSQGWWHPYSDASPHDLDHFVSLEAEAAEIRVFSVPFLYGLLQTEAYARALLDATFGNLGRDAVDGLVSIRIGRQEILTSAEPPTLRVILDESILRRSVGGPSVMRAQLEWLLVLSQRVDLRVRSFEAPPHTALLSAFTIFIPREAEIDPTVVNLESAFHDSYWEERSDVDQFTSSFEELEGTSLDPDESRVLISRLAQSWPDER